ncbi:MepB family protein [Roseivirga pacifica]
MYERLSLINDTVFSPAGLAISGYAEEFESKDYASCTFLLNEKSVVCRDAKITPKKVGQFVTFWKRIDQQPIAPFHQSDAVDFFVVNVNRAGVLGQFVFPKAVLIEKGIISTNLKEGKRAFRVYPSWDSPTSKQAQRTQQWQLQYFYEINDDLNFSRVRALFGE